MISTVRAMARLLRRSRLWLAVSAVLAIAQSALLVPIGLLVRRTLDHTIPGDHVGQLVLTGVLLVALSIGSAGLALTTRYLALRATKAAIGDLRSDLVALVLRLPASWFDRHEVGSSHAVIVQDTERLDVIGNAFAAQLVPATVIGIALSIALAVLDPLLFALLAVALPIIALLSRAMARLVRRRTHLWQEAFDAFSSRVLFILGARSLIVTHTAEDSELAAASREIEELSLTGRQMAWTQSAYGQLSATVGVITAVVVLVVGGAAVADHHTTVGSLVAFYALAALLRAQLSLVFAALPQLVAGGESLRRLQALLDVAETEPYTGARKIAFRGSMVLSAVQFGYRDGEPVLRGADLELHPGERVALVGANGAGKSTVAALMLGQYRPWQGELRADGVPFDELDIRSLRRRMAVVAEQPVLFPGTIAENITYGCSGADLASVRRAAQHATAEAFIESLPRGYATRVGERGGLLSGGQRQRIAITRALLREPALLILDEPTSNLDGDSVGRLLERLRELPWQPSVLLISHQRAVIDEADRVYELTAGRVCAAVRA